MLIIMWQIIVGISCAVFWNTEAAKILAVIPTPSISHQVPLRPLTQALAARGHDVVVITADPAFERGKSPSNLREVDVHDIAYEPWIAKFLPTSTRGHKEDLKLQAAVAMELNLETVVEQLKTDEVQGILRNETFDLLFVEAWARPALIYTHVYKNVPVVAISSWGGYFDNYEQIGAASHPLLYPKSSAQRLNNRTMWDKVIELYNYWDMLRVFRNCQDVENRELRKLFPDMPDINELHKNIDMMFINMHPIWDGNRPVPPSVVFMNGVDKKPHKELSKDLETYLNASTNGIIYVSFGTNVKPSTLPAEKVQTLINVFSQLPHNVLWRWDQDVLPGKTNNIKIFKWLPQSDLLRHPNIKLFVTQCGLQSTDEAIAAGVPLVGIPMLGDQWYNAEKYVQLKIGTTVDMETLDETKLKAAIDIVLGDHSYRNNIINLRSLMSDQPESGLDRVIWWTEHLLRHGSGRHLRAPSANLTWREYLELDLVVLILGIALVVFAIVASVVFAVVKKVYRKCFLHNKTYTKLKHS